MPAALACRDGSHWWNLAGIGRRSGIGWEMRKRMRAPDARHQAWGTVVSNPRRRLLAGTALTGAFIVVIAANPQSALAACAGENTASVTCDTTNRSEEHTSELQSRGLISYA